MKNQFNGVFTAIITPFSSDGSIDWKAYAALVERQIEGGVNGLVPCGTTGEAPTLGSEEQLLLISNTVRWARGRCAVVPGTGSNSTEHAVKFSQQAQALGVDGVLVVNPYYNKPTQEGLYRHFRAISDAIAIPIVVYNIKGRTAVNLETATLERLWSDCPNISAVKEASGDLTQIKAVLARCPKHFSVLSGDDNLTYDLMKAGGHGVVSVASNVIPAEVCALVQAILRKDLAGADQLYKRYLPFFEALFIETNPIPVKAALAMRGLCQEIYRLPLCEMGAENRKRFEVLARELNIV